MKPLIYIIVISLFLISTINIKAQDGIEWSACFGSPTGSIGGLRDACKTADGGYLLIGVTTPSDSVNWPFQAGNADFGLIKYG